MAEKQQIKATAVKVLCYVEKVSSFASSIDPLFGIVTSVIGVVKKGLVDEEDHEMHKDFKEIHEKLETISEKNKKVLQQIRMHEINQNYSKHKEAIKHQYKAFNTMVERVKLDPENSDHHMQEFVKIYIEDQRDKSLDVFYRGVMGTPTAFSSMSILQVYLDKCDRNKKVMEACCSHLAHLFSIGLMTLMAYVAVTEGDEDKVRVKWGQRVIEIQTKMQEALDQCTEEN
ncbi:protein rapunzel-like [Megalobrama amblycephala]|uniref:protein rapunzel-like n=1 Tax=Megalobrama amblycephala TaxID=75352 RepID=UPI0020141B70|nr:protein rapunzel-like [Megalobrama amblycephala]